MPETPLLCTTSIPLHAMRHCAVHGAAQGLLLTVMQAVGSSRGAIALEALDVNAMVA